MSLFLGVPNVEPNREILTRVSVVRYVRLARIVNAVQSQWRQADVLDIVLLYVNGRLMFPNARMILLAPMRRAYENERLLSFRSVIIERWITNFVRLSPWLPS